MRTIALLLLVLTTPAFAQTAAPSADWKSLGRPLDDDTKSMKDRYVYFNADTINKDAPVDQGILTKEQVAEWLSDHLSQAMTLNGKQYDTQIYNNRLLFTPDGYADYIVYLKTTNLGAFLKDNQYKVSAFVDGSPQITSQGVQAISAVNTYAWQATANIVLGYLDYRNQPPAALYKDSKADNRLAIQAKITLVRVPAQANGNMVAINHISFGPVPAATESLDPSPAGE